MRENGPGSDFKESALTIRRNTVSRTCLGMLTLRAGGTLIRVISARDMHRKEKVIYAQV